MEILNYITYAISVVVLTGIFILMLAFFTSITFDIIMSLKKKQLQKQQQFEDTDLRKEQN